MLQPRNIRNIPLRERQTVALARARLPSQSERLAAPAALRLRCAPPGRCTQQKERKQHREWTGKLTERDQLRRGKPKQTLMAQTADRTDNKTSR
jgi:hypothetical protein